MIRTVISLDPDDKAWLDRIAKKERVPMTRLVRRAIKRMREESEAKPSRFDELLKKTAGIGKGRFGDGLAYQRRLRKESERKW
jgi:predicted transcriptional regulator